MNTLWATSCLPSPSLISQRIWVPWSWKFSFACIPPSAGWLSLLHRLSIELARYLAARMCSYLRPKEAPSWLHVIWENHFGHTNITTKNFPSSPMKNPQTLKKKFYLQTWVLPRAFAGRIADVECDPVGAPTGRHFGSLAGQHPACLSSEVSPPTCR